MRRTIPVCTVALVLALTYVPSALAGPPLVCHPYQIGDRPDLMAKPGDGEIEMSWLVRTLTSTLDAENETLVRFEAIRQTAWMLDDVGGKSIRDASRVVERALSARAERARDAAAAAAALAGEGHDQARADELARTAAFRRYEVAFAHETFDHLNDCGHDDDERNGKTMRECAELIGDDAALWFGIARALTPLMRAGTLQEHASAFMKAWELTQALPVSTGREHLQATLDYELETMESYLLDGDLREAGVEPTPASRLEALRRAAGIARSEPPADVETAEHETAEDETLEQAPVAEEPVADER